MVLHKVSLQKIGQPVSTTATSRPIVALPPKKSCFNKGTSRPTRVVLPSCTCGAAAAKETNELKSMKTSMGLEKCGWATRKVMRSQDLSLYMSRNHDPSCILSTFRRLIRLGSSQSECAYDVEAMASSKEEPAKCDSGTASESRLVVLTLSPPTTMPPTAPRNKAKVYSQRRPTSTRKRDFRFGVCPILPLFRCFIRAADFLHSSRKAPDFTWFSRAKRERTQAPQPVHVYSFL